MVLLDFDRLTTQYAEELQAEGIPLSAPISAAAVISDLARLAGVPEPTLLRAPRGLHGKLTRYGGDELRYLEDDARDMVGPEDIDTDFYPEGA